MYLYCHIQQLILYLITLYIEIYICLNFTNIKHKTCEIKVFDLAFCKYNMIYFHFVSLNNGFDFIETNMPFYYFYFILFFFHSYDVWLGDSRDFRLLGNNSATMFFMILLSDSESEILIQSEWKMFEKKIGKHFLVSTIYSLMSIYNTHSHTHTYTHRLYVKPSFINN